MTFIISTYLSRYFVVVFHSSAVALSKFAVVHTCVLIPFSPCDILKDGQLNVLYCLFATKQYRLGGIETTMVA